MWVRRESAPPASATGTNAFAFLLDRTVSGTYYLDFGIQISDVNQRIIVTMNNIQQMSPQFSTMLKDNTWNYFAISLYRYSVGTAKGCRLRFMANVDGMNSVMSCANGYNSFTIDPQDTMTLVAYRSYIFNRIRVYQYAMSVDEIPQMVKTSASNNCVKKLGQNMCTICPEDGKCMTQCN